MIISLNRDSFSSGQISSKLWLCEKLEQTEWYSTLTHIYGGWYGMTGFLLLSRGNFKVQKIESYDIDPSCQDIADALNENWVWQNWKFKAFTRDCNQIDSKSADLIINTSTEHFESKEWFDRIPKGKRIVLQGNNMLHHDHHMNTNTLDEFKNLYPLSEFKFAGSLQFEYPTWGFARFMTIGIK